MFEAALDNPDLDEVLFVTQFINGLKPEVQCLVLSQVSSTVDRIAPLAKLQQDIQE